MIDHLATDPTAATVLASRSDPPEHNFLRRRPSGKLREQHANGTRPPCSAAGIYTQFAFFRSDFFLPIFKL